MTDTTLQPALVAIKCLVFNHEPYLRDCLEGFAMQQTDFQFVAIVHDDASTDHSADIIREYAAKYPDIILPIYETENQYSKQDGSLGRIMNAAIDATGAKYIALCEGDDYWTDPHKLQKQVDFLEIHPDYDMVCTRFSRLNHATGLIQNTDLYDHILSKEETGIELTHNHFIVSAIPQPCIVLYRNGTMHDNDLIGKLKYTFDYPVYWCFMLKHRVWLMNERMAMYRMHDGSLTATGEWWKVIYLAYLDILQYTPYDPILKRACAPFFRRIAVNHAKSAGYNMGAFTNDIKTYLSYSPSIRNVISLIRNILKALIAK